MHGPNAVIGFVGALVLLGLPASGASNALPPLAVQALRIEPSTLKLQDARDERRVLVLGKVEGEKWIDLTAEAKLRTDAAFIKIDPAGYIRGTDKGQANIIVSAGGQEAKLTVSVEDAGTHPI